MADVENVKKGLKIRSTQFNCLDKNCPYKDPSVHDCCDRLAGDALSVIEELQAEIARLQPKKGHWQMKPDPFGLFDGIPVCSECGCTNDMRKKTAFCEHCGADMREGDGDADGTAQIPG